jgi:hypothetical protein
VSGDEKKQAQSKAKAMGNKSKELERKKNFSDGGKIQRSQLQKEEKQSLKLMEKPGM